MIMRKNVIYLDNSTTARPSENAVSSMMPFFTEFWGIPHTLHQKGQELQSSLADSYRTLYSFVGADEKDQFVFTSSGSEAVSQVFNAVYRDVTLVTGKNQFLTAATDEAPAIMSAAKLEPLGCVTKMIPTKNGIITAQALADAISPRTALLSLSWGNGLTGIVQPLEEIISLCRQRGILVHLEATHVFGKLFFEFRNLGADYLTFNGDQIHAPKGTGGLFIKEGRKCSSLIAGGMEQGGYRGGAINMPGLVGLATAAKEALETRDFICTEISRLRDKFEDELSRHLPDTSIFFRDQERLPHCTAISFSGIFNESLLFLLNRKGVLATIGGGNFQQLSRLMVSSGIPEHKAHETISFSLSRYTTEEEIDRAILHIVDTAVALKKMSDQIIKKKSSL